MYEIRIVEKGKIIKRLKGDMFIVSVGTKTDEYRVKARTIMQGDTTALLILSIKIAIGIVEDEDGSRST